MAREKRARSEDVDCRKIWPRAQRVIRIRQRSQATSTRGWVAGGAGYQYWVLGCRRRTVSDDIGRYRLPYKLGTNQLASGVGACGSQVRSPQVSPPAAAATPILPKSNTKGVLTNTLYGSKNSPSQLCWGRFGLLVFYLWPFGLWSFGL